MTRPDVDSAPAWNETDLDSLCIEITVGHVGSMATQYEDRGIPFLRSQNVEYLRLNLTDVKYIGPEFHRRLRKSRLQPGDVVIVRTGAPGTCAVIPDSLREANCSDLVIVRCGPHLDPNFLAYYINSSAKHYVNAHLVGAVQQHFNVGSARTIRLRLPSIQEQRAIVAILGALDNKIELNRKMSATLEAIARALFKSWFVDFDPVRAKAEGRDLGLPAEIAALFPDAFDQAGSTSVPNRWTIATVGDVFVATMGQSPPGSTYNQTEDGLPFYQGRADFGFRFPKRRVYCKAPTRYANAGDTLLSVRAPVGDINLAIETCSIGRGVAALRHKGGSSSYTYYAAWFLKEALEAYNGEGTVFGSISKADLAKLPILEPPVGLVSAFDRICAPLDARVALCQKETGVLAALRDALLPKLISGELRVGDAERVLAASA